MDGKRGQRTAYDQSCRDDRAHGRAEWPDNGTRETSPSLISQMAMGEFDFVCISAWRLERIWELLEDG